MQELRIDRQVYQIEVSQALEQPPAAPRLVVVAYQPTHEASQVLRVCLQGIQKFTPQPHELWVVDNCSPPQHASWLLDWPGINLVLNHTMPRFPRGRAPLVYLKAWLRGQSAHPYDASYANAIGLEIAARVVNPTAQYLMTLHMDTLPCRENWLSFLQSKIQGRVAAAGVLKLHLRTPHGVLHILGCLLDFQRYQELSLDFLPDLPRYDVGDRITVDLARAGFTVYGCPNTLNNPELAEKIDPASPPARLGVFRAFDDDLNVIFMHLGRVIRKATGQHRRGVSPQEWIEFAHTYLLP